MNKSLFNQIIPGGFLLISFSLLSLFILLSTKSIIWTIVSLICIAYLCFIGYYKNDKIFLLLMMIVMIVYGILFVINDHQIKKFPNISKLTIETNIDEIQISDDYLHCVGYVKEAKQGIVIKGKVTDQLRKLLREERNISFITETCKVTPIAKATNEAEFDFRQYYLGKNIRNELNLSEYRVDVSNRLVTGWLHVLRYKLIQYFQTFPNNLRFLCTELITGYKDKNDRELLEDFSELGIIHLFCLSGLHVLVFIKIISFIFFNMRITENMVDYLIVISLLIFCVIGGGQPSLVRAIIGYLIRIIFKKVHIFISPIDSFSITMIVHMMLSPNLFFNVGAQLSYLLVLGIKIMPNVGKIRQNILINLMITPLLLHHFYTVNIFIFIYNILLSGLFKNVLFPLTIIATLTMWVLRPIFQFIDVLLKIFFDMLSRLSEFSLGKITFGQIDWIMVFILTVTTFFMITYLRNKKSKYWLLIIYVVVFISIHFPIQGSVTLIDIGQGDSILITTPLNRKIYLIDTGGKLSFGKKKSSSNNVDKITIPYLKSKGISQIDGVFLSHQDADHIGDLPVLLKKIKVKHLFFGTGMQDNPNFIKKVVPFKNKIQFHQVQAGNIIEQFNILNPITPGLGENKDSVVMQTTINHKSWLFTGDLDQEGELKVINLFPNLKVDVLKVGHHGSKTSSNKDFIAKINPQVALISVGRNNRYHHPNQETIETLSKAKIPIFQTAKCGMITYKYDLFGNEQWNYFGVD